MLLAGISICRRSVVVSAFHTSQQLTFCLPTTLFHSNHHTIFSKRKLSSIASLTTTLESEVFIHKIPAKFIPKPFDYHEEIEITIDSLTNQGLGVGRVLLPFPEEEIESKESTREGHEIHQQQLLQPQQQQDPESQRLWVVMVPHVLVGERVKVRIFRNMKNYSEADLMKVIVASPDRVTPQCKLAGICGGCQYQHISIEAQRAWKQRHVQEVLLQQQIQGYTTIDTVQVLPTRGTEHIYHYRSKLTPHYQAPIESVLEDDVEGMTTTTTLYHLEAIGFQRSSSRRLVDVSECPIATPAINKKYQETRERLYQQSKQGLFNSKNRTKKSKKRGSRRNSGGALGATLLFRQADDDPVTGEPVVITDHNAYMTTTVRGIQFRYLAGNFFQNNNHVLPLMVDAVVQAAIQPVTGTGEAPKFLLDCYCGSGLFALSAARYFDLCVGIEVNERATEEAFANARLNNITNCQFVAASAEAIFTTPPKLTVPKHEKEQVQDLDRQQTVVVLDPPRKGCSLEFLDQLYEYQPQRILYMSCDPATQARDAKGIVEIGGYDIISIQPFDLFPQTKHIESLIVFEKKQR